MAKQSDFDSFLTNINPSKTTIDYISSVQTNLRDYLKNHSKYKDIFEDSFLSGSYAKHTSIRPVLGDKKRDVDIIVVTNYTSVNDSKNVIEELKDILVEKKIYESATVQSHSVGIELSGIAIDIVPVIVDEDDDSLYYVGDVDTGDWIKTDPKGHKSWSTTINVENNNKYKPLVKIFKWWRRTNCPEDVKYPKGITLEKIIADNIGESTIKTEDMLIETMQNIISAYKEDYVDLEENPVIEDPSEKIEGNDLLSGYSENDFKEFILKIEEHIELLNIEGTGNDVWKKILGNEFPSETKISNSFEISAITRCLTASHRQRPLWPYQRGGAAFIQLTVTQSNGIIVDYTNNGEALEKYCSLQFKAVTTVKKPFIVKWQIVNTGEEAMMAKGLRGGFDDSDCNDIKNETTQYKGTHSVQCFIIKKGVCVAKSKEFIINIK